MNWEKVDDRKCTYLLITSLFLCRENMKLETIAISLNEFAMGIQLV